MAYLIICGVFANEAKTRTHIYARVSTRDRRRLRRFTVRYARNDNISRIAYIVSISSAKSTFRNTRRPHSSSRVSKEAEGVKVRPWENHFPSASVTAGYLRFTARARPSARTQTRVRLVTCEPTNQRRVLLKRRCERKQGREVAAAAAAAATARL